MSDETRENLQEGVVPTEEWREIPGFPGYLASSLGNLRKLKKGKWVAVHQSRWTTSIGHYLRSSVKNADGIHESKGVHHLVCLAFHGPPPADGLRYEVNHKDGIKINNCQDNLEWLSKSGNYLHAMGSGLRRNHSIIQCEDVETGSKTTYSYLSAFMEAFGFPNTPAGKSAAFRAVSKGEMGLYKGRYRFKRDYGNGAPISRKKKQFGDFIYRDYRDGTVSIDNSLRATAVRLQIPEATIRWHLTNEPSKMVNGIVFFRLRSNLSWPVFSENQIQQSIDRWNTRASAGTQLSDRTPPDSEESVVDN